MAKDEQNNINDIDSYYIPSLIISETIEIDAAKINLAINTKENLVFNIIMRVHLGSKEEVVSFFNELEDEYPFEEFIE